jgi:hypothetical protein
MYINLFRFSPSIYNLKAGLWSNQQEERPEGLADIEIDTTIAMTDAVEVAAVAVTIGEHS